MKVVFISGWYSEGMGYSENLFPKAMANLEVDVHVVTSTAQIYYYLPKYDKVYKPHLGPNIVDAGLKKIDGYTLHRLPYYNTKNIYNGPGIQGLYDYLETLKPDVIQTFEILTETSIVAAKYAKDKNCLFFTESHMHASVFRDGDKKTTKERVKRLLNVFSSQLKLINSATTICYPIAKDVAELAMSHYRVPTGKIKIQSLGVDTELFFQPKKAEDFVTRDRIRASFGFKPTDIVCIYTGRFTKDKNPHCLAQAINDLNEQGLPFKGLFVGNGLEEDVDFIQSQKGCKVVAFVPANQLPSYYWSADIGVWPREESTSQLDAAACGLPLVLSNKVKVIERVDGNGFLYEEGNYTDLVNVLKKLFEPETRKKMSEIGINKINKLFSWNVIATQRLDDYKSFFVNKASKQTV
jgi:glycosyltransferase involved in cell wall biosynthesis